MNDLESQRTELCLRCDQRPTRLGICDRCLLGWNLRRRVLERYHRRRVDEPALTLAQFEQEVAYAAGFGPKDGREPDERDMQVAAGNFRKQYDRLGNVPRVPDIDRWEMIRRALDWSRAEHLRAPEVAALPLYLRGVPPMTAAPRRRLVLPPVLLECGHRLKTWAPELEADCTDCGARKRPARREVALVLEHWAEAPPASLESRLRALLRGYAMETRTDFWLPIAKLCDLVGTDGGPAMQDESVRRAARRLGGGEDADGLIVTFRDDGLYVQPT